jgi:SAM-dependent methyltransferase
MREFEVSHNKENSIRKTQDTPLKMLDIGCGMGGTSDGFAMEDFDVTGIDIVDAQVILGYKHQFIHADIRDLKGEEFKGFDVIWISMPCRDHSKMRHVGLGSKRSDSKGKWAWKKPPNPKESCKLIYTCLEFVVDAKPKIWIMENVPDLQNDLFDYPSDKRTMQKLLWGLGTYFQQAHMICKIEPTKKRAFWGNFPEFLMPLSNGLSIAKNVKRRIYCIQGKNRSWKRARIPLACSRAFARACKEKLLEMEGYA